MRRNDFLLVFLLLVGGCSSSTQTIKTFQPPPTSSVIDLQPVKDTVNLGNLVVLPTDTLLTGQDTTNNQTVKVYVRKRQGQYTAKVVTKPPQVIIVDTIKTKVDTVVVHKPTVAEYVKIIFITIGVFTVFLILMLVYLKHRRIL
jgi:hypothetical protein